MILKYFGRPWRRMNSANDEVSSQPYIELQERETGESAFSNSCRLLNLPVGGMRESSISDTVYNPLTCDIEPEEETWSKNLQLRLKLLEQIPGESHSLQSSIFGPSCETSLNQHHSIPRKQWAFRILCLFIIAIVTSGVLGAIIIISAMHKDPPNDFLKALKDNENTIFPNSVPLSESPENLNNNEHDKQIHNEGQADYILNSNQFKLLKSIVRNRNASLKVSSRLRTIEHNDFPILDAEAREDLKFRNELRLNSKYFQQSGSNSIHKYNHIEDIEILKNIDKIKAADVETIREGMKFGNQELVIRLAIENEIQKSGLVPQKRSPESFHQLFKKISEEARRLGLTGFAMTKASQRIAERLNMSKSESREGVVAPTLFATEPNNWCGQRANLTKTCNETYPFRSIDGTCNNLNVPVWGSAMQTYRRILLNDYADGVNEPRVAFDESSLPNPIHVSRTILLTDLKNTSDKEASMMVPLWAQFIAFDLSNTIQSGGENNNHISCCANGTLVEIQHPECFPIHANISDDWEFHNNVDANHRCITFLRSAPAPICHFGPREQFNEYTSYLDASNIYGSSQTQLDSIRALNSDQLNVFTTPDGRTLLPNDKYEYNDCNTPSQTEQNHSCFQSGDARTNANLGFTSMQTLWTRQHNRIALILHSLNWQWTHDRVFEEARRIVIAQIQHITYNGFLPILLGKELMKRARLQLLEKGDFHYYKDYDPTMDSTLSNVFATVANRYGHSLLKEFRIHNQPEIQHYFFYPFPLYQKGKIDAIIKSYSMGKSGQADTIFTRQMTEQMFQKDNFTFGLDIAAINIQRGRDHGIPGYTAWRNICKLTNISSFEDLNNIWDAENVRHVQQVYKSVHDIDLYIGGLSEKQIKGGLVGPTFGCLIADQFTRLREGDRFWYEGDKYESPFKPDQLKEIRKITLARVLCQNGDNFSSSQANVFKQLSSENELSPCNKGVIPIIDYTLWEEKTEKVRPKMSLGLKPFSSNGIQKLNMNILF